MPNLFSEYPVQIGKDSSGIDSGVNVHVLNGVRDTCLIKWDRINVNVEEFGS